MENTINISPVEYFNSINLSLLNPEAAKFIKEEVLTDSQLSQLNSNDPDFINIYEYINSNYKLAGYSGPKSSSYKKLEQSLSDLNELLELVSDEKSINKINSKISDVKELMDIDIEMSSDGGMMAKGGGVGNHFINPRKRYSVGDLIKLGYKKITGKKSYYYYFEKDGKIFTFKVIPQIGNNIVSENETRLALVVQETKMAKGGGVDNYKYFKLNDKGNFASELNGKNYEVIYRDDKTQMYDLFENGKKIKSSKNVRNVMTFAKGGGVDGELQFIEYKDQEIMYEPAYNEYFVNDEKFDSLQEAKKYIDSGSQMSKKTINAYRHGAFKKGGKLKKSKK